MKKFIGTFLSAVVLYGVEYEPVHSSLLLYMESKDFANSKQKLDGKVFGIGMDVHQGASEYRLVVERAKTTTKKPPLTKDLQVSKLYGRYLHSFGNTALHVNYLSVLHDNIAITDGGDAYGVGVAYDFNKKLSTDFTQFFTDYKDFDVYQSNLTLDYKMRLQNTKLKLTIENFAIKIDEQRPNNFTKNAQNSYFTTALKLHAHYALWHFGSAIFFGKRAFAIMNDGFKIQHHAMEFDRTYALGLGRSFGKTIVRMQYIYQRAKELPIQNSGVEVRNVRLLFNYKF